MNMPLTLGKQLTDMLPLVAIIILMVVITVLPQRKRTKAVKKMMSEMKRGDWVKTIGGLTGKIAAIDDNTVTVETGPQHVQLTFTRGAIASVGNAEVENEGISEADTNVATKSEKKK
jgi:preprotein translocase subunit YajC